MHLCETIFFPQRNYVCNLTGLAILQVCVVKTVSKSLAIFVLTIVASLEVAKQTTVLISKNKIVAATAYFGITWSINQMLLIILTLISLLILKQNQMIKLKYIKVSRLTGAISEMTISSKKPTTKINHL